MMKFITSLLLALVFANCAMADHKAGASWSWHVQSGGLDESRVAIYRKQEMVGIFNFSCDLTAAVDVDMSAADASLQLLQPASNPGGLLVVSCNVGAHSQYIAIVDPASKTSQPVFARTGSYFVSWELEDGELWISHDRPCAGGPSVECPDGFETIFEQYPAQP